MRISLKDFFWMVVLAALGIACWPGTPLVCNVAKLAPPDLLGMNKKVVVSLFMMLYGGFLGTAALVLFHRKRIGAIVGLAIALWFVCDRL